MKVISILLLILLSQETAASRCLMDFMDRELARQEGIADVDYDPLRATTNRTEIIFTGVAVTTMKKVLDSIDMESTIMEIVTEFEVTEIMKGEPLERVVVQGGLKPSTCQCGYNFEPGVEYLVLADKVDSNFTTTRCKYIRPKKSSLYKDFLETINAMP